jgi:hypothetical protein
VALGAIVLLFWFAVALYDAYHPDRNAATLDILANVLVWKSIVSRLAAIAEAIVGR